jgi:hypothetical protein
MFKVIMLEVSIMGHMEIDEDGHDFTGGQTAFWTTFSLVIS